jgi:NADH-quinone oxidoreductase subunit C
MHHPQHPGASTASIELHDNVKSLLSAKFGDALIRSQIDYDFPVFVIRKDAIHDVLAFLKDSADTGFTYLTTMCGIHFPDNTGEEFAMMYQLHNMQRNLRIRLKVFMGTKDLTLPTATDLWAAANWMEREAFDFYGFKFSGHPNLTRILNMDEMNYHPLRKEYALEDATRDDKKDEYFGR